MARLGFRRVLEWTTAFAARFCDCGRFPCKRTVVAQLHSC